jgi:hypothetical protein
VSARNCTAWWSSEDGRCSDDDSGAGRHACRLTDTGLGSDQERVHTTCECRCGATAERPEPTLPEDLGSIGRATVRVDEHGMGKVMIDLTDVSNLVSSGTVAFKAGHATTVTLGFPHAVMALSGGRGQMDEETAKALEALGWSGPDTELLRRRDLREALDHFGPADPDADWDALLLCVRGVAFRLKHEPIALAVLLDLPSTASMESIEAKVRELQAKAGEQP